MSTGKQRNFRKYRPNRADVQGIPYDYDSLMHYGAYAFAKNRSIPVIQPKDPSVDLRRLGQNWMFSQNDILQVNKRYCPGMDITVNLMHIMCTCTVHSQDNVLYMTDYHSILIQSM